MIKRIKSEHLQWKLTAINFDLLNAVENETDLDSSYHSNDELLSMKIGIRHSLVGLCK